MPPLHAHMPGMTAPLRDLVERVWVLIPAFKSSEICELSHVIELNKSPGFIFRLGQSQ